MPPEFFGKRRVFGVDGGGVAEAVEFDHLPRLVDAVLRAVGFGNGDDGRELFAGQRFFFADFTDFGGEDAGTGRHTEAGLFGNPRCRAANDIGVEFALRAVFAVCFHAEAVFFQERFFFFVDEMDVVAFQLFHEVVVDFLVDDHRLFGGADHAVVEGFAHHDVVCGLAQVSRFFDVGGNVARANAERRFAAGIGGAHHSVTAGGEDGGNAVMLHQGVGRF